MHETHAELETRLKRLTAELAEAKRSLEAETAGRSRAEHELKKALEQWERSKEDLRQFSDSVSHDLREPLRAVAGFAQLLRRRYQGQLDAAADEYIQFAVDGVSRMQRMLDDLLVYSRIGTHGGPLGPVDCNEVVDATIVRLETVIAEHSASVTRDDLPAVTADRMQLVGLFEGLIQNAIKFRGQKPPQVHVSARRSENGWIFSVRDNGLGIDPKHAGQIFLMFRRLHAPEKYPGTGAGLAISKRIVQRHGGEIRVESEPGKGATFHFTIHADQPESQGLVTE